ncbi:hypothetical protein OG948_25390 [Embleya sp. NBC_00888]|nr:hypothetical protein OG948_25390 [Embleya sp. NBC_00888]
MLARKERPRSGTQLRITDVDGNRCVAFVTNTADGPFRTLNCATADAHAPKTTSA